MVILVEGEDVTLRNNPKGDLYPYIYTDTTVIEAAQVGACTTVGLAVLGRTASPVRT